MRKILFIVSLILIQLPLFSQDIIYKINGEEIKAKVSEVDLTTIKYRRFDNPTGPIYTIKKSEVSKIKYENGTVDVFQEEQSDDDVLNEVDSLISGKRSTSDYGYNIIAFNPIHVAFKNLTFSYEVFTPAQKLGFKIPLSFGLGKVGYFASGIYFKFYPTTSAGKVKYFIGPYLQFAGDADNYYGSLQLDNGISFQPVKAFNLSLDFSIGPGQQCIQSRLKDFFRFKKTYYNDQYVAWLFGLTLGWRF